MCRFSGTPGDVLNRHTEACCDLHTVFLRAFFSVPHHIHRTQNTYHRRHTTTTPRAHTHTHNTTTTQHQHNTKSHGERHREMRDERERDCEKRELKTSEDTQIRQTNEESNSVRLRLFVTVLSSTIRLQLYRWGNSAKITDIHISGPVIKNHIVSQMAENTNTTRKTKYRSL